MFSGQFYEKRLSVRERNMKLLLETVTEIAMKVRVTWLITIDTVTCIMHCRKYHLHNCNRDPICIIAIKIVTHIFATKAVTCICTVEISNCITATETATCIIVTQRSTNIPVTESTTGKPAKTQHTSLA